MPITKSKSMTPISANTFSAAISDKRPAAPLVSLPALSDRNGAQRGESGPIYIPAKRYPMINGCLILKNASVTIPARIMIIARSVTNASCGNCNGFILSMTSHSPPVRSD